MPGDTEHGGRSAKVQKAAKENPLDFEFDFPLSLRFLYSIYSQQVIFPTWDSNPWQPAWN